MWVLQYVLLKLLLLLLFRALWLWVLWISIWILESAHQLVQKRQLEFWHGFCWTDWSVWGSTALSTTLCLQIHEHGMSFYFFMPMWLVLSNSLWSHGLQPTRVFCLWDFSGKTTGVGCHFLLQGIFLTYEPNACLTSPAFQVDSLLAESSGRSRLTSLGLL